MDQPSSSSARKHTDHFPARAGRVNAWFILPVVLAGGGFWFWMAQYGGDAGMRAGPTRDEPQISAVPRIVTIGYGNVTNVIPAAGSLSPREIVAVPARASGELVEIHVELGDQVEAGQALAQIDPIEQELRTQSDQLGLESLKIQVPQMHLELETAQTAARRVEAAITDRIDAAAAQQMRDEARNAVMTAQTSLQNLLLQIQQAETRLEQSRLQLRYTTITAPIAGTVMEFEQRKGAVLFAGESPPIVARIADLSTMSVEAEVSDADVVALSPGMEAYLTTFRGGDRVWTGSLRQIEPRPASTRDLPLYTVRFDVDNADGELFSGMSAQVYFVTSYVENVLVVPVAALTFPDSSDSRNASVELVLPDGSSEVRSVVLGIADRINAEVLSGLAAGDRVVAGVIET